MLNYNSVIKNEKKGLWQGKFEMPWDFRRKK